MQYLLSKQFEKDYARLPKATKVKVLKALELFLANHTESGLRAHALSGKWRDHYSIDITGDIRAVYTYVSDKTIVRFVAVGSHSELYK